MEEKTVAGSWLSAAKKCSRCSAELKSGMLRHSCKPCKYHLCISCHEAASAEWLREEITITIYRAAFANVEEDTLQVRIERGARIGTLRMRIFELYGMPPPMQVIRRDVDSAPLADDESLSCDTGDVMHLTQAGPGDLLRGTLGIQPGASSPFSGLADALERTMAQVSAHAQEVQRQLESTNYNLTFVLPAQAGHWDEKRCPLEVAAVSHMSEVLDMVKLELDVESIAQGLEFAGELLPLMAPVHMVGVGDGDTLIVVVQAPVTTV